MMKIRLHHDSSHVAGKVQELLSSMKKTTKSIARKAIRVALGACVIGMTLSCVSKKDESQQPAEQVQVTSEELKPDNFFHQSQEAFANKDYEGSAQAIRNAIAVMKEIAAVTDEKQLKDIQLSIDELYDLASSVAVDKVEGIEELNFFFARAGKALAGLHMHTTEKYYFNLEGKKAGSELLKVVDIVQQTVQYHGRKLSEPEMNLLTDLRLLSVRLATGKASKKELEDALKKLSLQLTQWDADLSIQYSSIAHKRETVIHNQIN
jgi:hypothetical protein